MLAERNQADPIECLVYSSTKQANAINYEVSVNCLTIKKGSK